MSRSDERRSERSRAGKAASRASQEADEKLLVDALQSGNAQAFEELVRTNSGRMLAVTRRILRNEEDARDAVQDAFLQAFQKIGSFQRGSLVSTWLHRIAVNAALMKLRSRRRKPEEPLDPLLPSFLPDGHRVDPGPAWSTVAADEIDRRRLLALVREQIEKLPESYRTVILLRDVEGLSTEEAAQALGIGTDAVKMRLHRARQGLRTLLDPHMRPVTA
jgi:RNA polymerase sigma-70 factor (ECF subfamily)